MDWLAELAHSEPGAQAAVALTPDLSPAQALENWALIGEARAALSLSESPDLRDHHDLTEILSSLGPEGARLNLDELKLVGEEAKTSALALGWLKGFSESSPKLSAIAAKLASFDEIVSAVARTIGPDGEILDGASPRLASLRQEISGARSALSLRLGELVRSEEYKPLLMDDLVTTRNDRFVIPVRASAAGRGRGLVHDWSNTGATAYLEPLETVEDNNRLAKLKREELREIDRILASLSALCREQAPLLRAAGQALTLLDLTLAEARLASQWRAWPPDYVPGQGFALVGARHPVLERRLQAEGRRMVSLDLNLRPDRPVLVISGVNAGGKTVALKTFGLVLAAAASGLVPPLAEGSVIDFPSDVLTVMGDGQDLSADLSTFSSHVKALGEVLEAAGPGILILVDELGSGTDPAEGAALGLAALERLLSSGALVMAATHFNLIKSWAALTDGVESVSVNAKTSGQPAYGLSYGAPGYSGGLVMARRLGLPSSLVDRAESLLDDGQRLTIELARKLDEERGKIQAEREEVAEAKGRMERLEAQMKEQSVRRTEEHNRLVSGLDKQIKSALANNRREQAALKDEVRKALAENRPVDPVAAALAWSKMEKELSQARPEYLKEKDLQPVDSVSVGDVVLVSSFNSQGLVKAVNRERDEYAVEIGGLTVKVGLAELMKPQKEKKKEKSFPSLFLDVGPVEHVLTLNLVGQTVDEAETAIDKEIDRALISGQERLTIIHGVGSGRLRQGVINHLRRHRLVRSFFSPRDVPGGAGITEVELMI